MRMNITSYLPDELVEALDRLAQKERTSRSAVIRFALEAYLRRLQPGSWPDEVMSWSGDAQFPPFESLRGVEQRAVRDPFDPSSNA
jgi:predicted transcriptional regulator